MKFYADWCGPCRTMKPVAEELAKEFDLELREINVDNEPELMLEYEVRSIPTLILTDGVDEITRFVGSAPKMKTQAALGL